jgi:hypothetical protein
VPYLPGRGGHSPLRPPLTRTIHRCRCQKVTTNHRGGRRALPAAMPSPSPADDLTRAPARERSAAGSDATMSDRRDGAPQQQVDRLHVEDSCRTARSSPTCPSLQSLVNALFHLAAWIAPGDYAPSPGTGAVVSIPATG